MEGFRRPPLRVLGDDALVPERNRTTPPERFSHRLTVAQDYYYEPPSEPRAPDGAFPQGTRLWLESDEGDFCWVVDEAGVRVATARAGLSTWPG